MSYPQCKQLVQTALDHGVNYMDTAPFYGLGKSESLLGQTLRDLKLENSKAYNRNQYYLSSKVGRYGFNEFDFSVKKTKESLEQSLEKLQCDHLDIVFVHDIEFAEHLEQIWEETLPFLYELKKSKKNPIIKNIGISGMPPNVLDHVMNQFGYDKVDAIITYNSHILFNNELLTYLPRWKKYNIGIVHGGVTGLGLLTPKGTQEWHPANHLPVFRQLCEEAMKHLMDKKSKDLDLDLDLELLRLGFLYCYDNKLINSVLVGANNEHELVKYTQWSSQSAGKEEKDQISWLQNNIFAPIMNRMWVDPGTEKNICNSFVNFYK